MRYATSVKTRLLIVDADVARRLRAVAALSERFDALPVPEGEDPLRIARTGRADMALLGITRRDPNEMARLSRMLRTDLRPVARIAVYGTTSIAAEAAFDQWQIDAFAGEEMDAASLLHFVEAAWRGERVARGSPAPTGPLARLYRRIRGR